jgi:hypothetical protein
MRLFSITDPTGTCIPNLNVVRLVLTLNEVYLYQIDLAMGFQVGDFITVNAGTPAEFTITRTQ